MQSISFLHKYISIKHFYHLVNKVAKPICWLGIILLAISLTWGLVFAPADYQQGDSFRIIYLHVPVSFLAQSIYMFMAIAGAIFLIWRIKIFSVFIHAAAITGCVMASLALITGAIWGKPTWGTYWIWDARLTSMLIQWFLYLGIITLASSISIQEASDKAVSILSIIGAINIPIIKYSVNWWNSLHQGSTFSVTEAPKMPASMWVPLLIALIGFYLFATGVVLQRMQLILLQRSITTRWFKEIIS